MILLSFVIERNTYPTLISFSKHVGFENLPGIPAPRLTSMAPRLTIMDLLHFCSKVHQIYLAFYKYGSSDFGASTVPIISDAAPSVCIPGHE